MKLVHLFEDVDPNMQVVKKYDAKKMHTVDPSNFKKFILNDEFYNTISDAAVFYSALLKVAKKNKYKFAYTEAAYRELASFAKSLHMVRQKFDEGLAHANIQSVIEKIKRLQLVLGDVLHQVQKANKDGKLNQTQARLEKIYDLANKSAAEIRGWKDH